MQLAFPFYISLAPFAIAVLALLLGVFLHARVNRFLGQVIGAFGILFGLAFGPTLLMDRVIVDESGIHQNTGLWFGQTKNGFGFDGIKRVRITTGSDREGSPVELWIAEYADRPRVQLEPGRLWLSNGDAIAKRMRDLGIEVLRERD